MRSFNQNQCTGISYRPKDQEEKKRFFVAFLKLEIELPTLSLSNMLEFAREKKVEK